MTDALHRLNQRRSVPARQLGAPGPDPDQLSQLLQAAVRVPDHGKLAPWRLILLKDQAKLRFGEQLAALEADPELPASHHEKNLKRYTYAPLVITVIASPVAQSKVPRIEQLMSAGCLCYNLLHGAHVMGFGAQWLTGWAAYDPRVHQLLDLAEHEEIVGFVHVGTAQLEVPERDRPDIDTLISTWTP
jgi:nitroreductase